MMENNIIITIYGCYNKYLDAIGVGYVERNYIWKKCVLDILNWGNLKKMKILKMNG